MKKLTILIVVALLAISSAYSTPTTTGTGTGTVNVTVERINIQVTGVSTSHTFILAPGEGRDDLAFEWTITGSLGCSFTVSGTWEVSSKLNLYQGDLNMTSGTFSNNSDPVGTSTRSAATTIRYEDFSLDVKRGAENGPTVSTYTLTVDYL